MPSQKGRKGRKKAVEARRVQEFRRNSRGTLASMRARRRVSGLLVPAVLVGLVVVLAALQYRWLGQVSEAERVQLQRSLTQRGKDFTDEFDKELSQAYAALRMTPEELASGPSRTWPDGIDRWRAASRFPGLVKAIYLATHQETTLQLRPYLPGSRTFADLPIDAWPPSLKSSREEIERSAAPARAASIGDGRNRVFSLAVHAVVADGAALLIPVVPLPAIAHDIGTGRPPAAAAATWLAIADTRRSFVIAELDRDYIRRTVLPALAAKHFPEDGPYAFRVAVVSGRGDALFTKQLSADAIASLKPDVSMPMMTIRLDAVGSPFASGTNVLVRASGAFTATADVPAPPTKPSQISIFVEQRGREPFAPVTVVPRGVMHITDDGWRLLIEHSLGSVDAAVTWSRRVNLFISFSILLLLSGVMLLVLVNARRAQQLAARQMDFVATVTHELRTPLAVIRSAAQNLSAGVVADPGQARRYGELIDREGERLTDTVEQVLAYAGLEGGRAPRATSAVDLVRVVAGVLAASQALLDESGLAIDFEPQEAEAPPMVQGDEAGLRLVVQNLVSNAAKHGADGRWIGVSVEARAERGRPVVCVSVRDRGRGIDAEDRAHVFEPFYRGRRALDSQVRGNGLGLSLVKRIVDAHGGRVSVESPAGGGAVFTVCLPAAPPGAGASDAGLASGVGA
jgi:signal transduction histidine kinase